MDRIIRQWALMKLYLFGILAKGWIKDWVYNMGKWGRSGQGKAIVKDISDRGFVRVGDIYFPPGSKEAISSLPKKKSRSKIVRTGWTDDIRNIRNKEKYHDPFINLVKTELSLEVWPEFFFSVDRLYRFDYAIPEFKIGIEINGGVWAKGHSGHSSGKGIMRDYEKSNLAQSLGWKVLTMVPSQIKNYEALQLLINLLK